MPEIEEKIDVLIDLIRRQEQKLDNITTYLEEMLGTKESNVIEKALIELSNKEIFEDFDNIIKKVENLEKEEKDTEPEINKLNTKIHELNTKINELNTKINELNKEINQINKKIHQFPSIDLSKNEEFSGLYFEQIETKAAKNLKNDDKQKLEIEKQELEKSKSKLEIKKEKLENKLKYQKNCIDENFLQLQEKLKTVVNKEVISNTAKRAKLKMIINNISMSKTEYGMIKKQYYEINQERLNSYLNNLQADIKSLKQKKINPVINFLLKIITCGFYSKNERLKKDIEDKKNKIVKLNEQSPFKPDRVTDVLKYFKNEVNSVASQNQLGSTLSLSEKVNSVELQNQKLASSDIKPRSSSM